jgi:hypothetical protein
MVLWTERLLVFAAGAVAGVTWATLRRWRPTAAVGPQATAAAAAAAAGAPPARGAASSARDDVVCPRHPRSYRDTVRAWRLMLCGAPLCRSCERTAAASTRWCVGRSGGLCVRPCADACRCVVQVLVVRNDLGMGKGKAAAQVRQRCPRPTPHRPSHAHELGLVVCVCVCVCVCVLRDGGEGAIVCARDAGGVQGDSQTQRRHTGCVGGLRPAQDHPQGRVRRAAVRGPLRLRTQTHTRTPYAQTHTRALIHSLCLCMEWGPGRSCSGRRGGKAWWRV